MKIEPNEKTLTVGLTLAQRLADAPAESAARRALLSTEFAKFSLRVEPTVRIHELDRSRNGLQARLHHPSGVEAPAPVAVFFHGGGFGAMSPADYDGLASHLAAAARCLVLVPEYRLAPEHPYPAARDDALAAYEWAVQHAAELKGDSRRYAVIGESAGGTLAAAVSHHRAGQPGGPLLQGLINPVLDMAGATGSRLLPAATQPVTPAGIKRSVDAYMRTANVADPKASPLLQPNLTGIADTIILVGDQDPVLDESLIYASRLREAGVPVSLTVYGGMVHAFTLLAGALDEGYAAIHQLAALMRRRFDHAS